MEALYNPVGFAADFLAICRACGVRTPAEKREWNELMGRFDEIDSKIDQHSESVLEAMQKIQDTIRDCSISNIRTRLPKNLSIPSELHDLTLNLLFVIKSVKMRIVFAIVVRSPSRNYVKTVGMAGASTDRIDDVFLELNRVQHSLQSFTNSKTTFITARCRGKTNTDLENNVLAALACITMEVLGLPPVVDLTDMHLSDLAPCGNKTIGLLRAKTQKVEREKWDELCRIFIIGDTRTGKSTLGNAMTQNTTFTVSKSTTGTLNVCCEKILESINDNRWLTEIYDTPGLNDKDHLDNYYLASIEDTIVAVNEINALVLTVSVSEGIKGSILDSIKTYKKLFGKRMTSLLFVVLTTNDRADEEECEELIDVHYSTIVGYISDLDKRNMLCVSLRDLRNGTDTYSHLVVSDLIRKCQSMELKIVESLMEDYADLVIHLRRNRRVTQEQLQKRIDNEWLQYEELRKEYESASYSKVCIDNWGLVNGFVHKDCSRITKKLLSVKTTIHIAYTDIEIWRNFVRAERNSGDSTGAMRRFFDAIEKEGLAVIVEEMATRMCFAMKVRRHIIRLWNPRQDAAKALREFIDAKKVKLPDLEPYIFERLENQNLAAIYGQGFKKKGSSALSNK